MSQNLSDELNQQGFDAKSFPTIDMMIGHHLRSFEKRMESSKTSYKVVGVVICQNVKCRKPIPEYITIQGRSLDEGATILATCKECGTTFKQNS